jgi:hypothetical protein
MKQMRVTAKVHWSDWKFSEEDGELYCPACAERLEEKYNVRMTPMTKDFLKPWRTSDGAIFLDCATRDCPNYYSD